MSAAEHKRERLLAAGWNVGDAQQFLGLTDEEMELVEARRARSASGAVTTVSTAEHKRVDRNFTYHKPTEDQVEHIQELRERFCELAHRVVELVPEGRERSIALTHLEEANMQVNAGIVRPPIKR